MLFRGSQQNPRQQYFSQNPQKPGPQPQFSLASSSNKCPLPQQEPWTPRTIERVKTSIEPQRCQNAWNWDRNGQPGSQELRQRPVSFYWSPRNNTLPNQRSQREWGTQEQFRNTSSRTSTFDMILKPEQERTPMQQQQFSQLRLTHSKSMSLTAGHKGQRPSEPSTQSYGQWGQLIRTLQERLGQLGRDKELIESKYRDILQSHSYDSARKSKREELLQSELSLSEKRNQRLRADYERQILTLKEKIREMSSEHEKSYSESTFFNNSVSGCNSEYSNSKTYNFVERRNSNQMSQNSVNGEFSVRENNWQQNNYSGRKDGFQEREKELVQRFQTELNQKNQLIKFLEMQCYQNLQKGTYSNTINGNLAPDFGRKSAELNKRIEELEKDKTKISFLYEQSRKQMLILSKKNGQLENENEILKIRLQFLQKQNGETKQKISDLQKNLLNVSEQYDKKNQLNRDSSLQKLEAFEKQIEKCRVDLQKKCEQLNNIERKYEKELREKQNLLFKQQEEKKKIILQFSKYSDSTEKILMLEEKIEQLTKKQFKLEEENRNKQNQIVQINKLLKEKDLQLNEKQVENKNKQKKIESFYQKILLEKQKQFEQIKTNLEKVSNNNKSQQIEIKDSKNQQLINKCRQLEQKCSTLTKKLDLMSKQQENIISQNKITFESLKNELSQKNSIVVELEQRTKLKQGELVELKNKLEKYEDTLTSKQNELNSKNKQIILTKEQMTILHKKCMEKDEQIEKLKGQCVKMNENVRKLQIQVQQYEVEIFQKQQSQNQKFKEEANEKINKIQSGFVQMQQKYVNLEQQNKVLSQNLSVQLKKNKKLRQEIDNLKNKIESLNNTLEESQRISSLEQEKQEQLQKKCSFCQQSEKKLRESRCENKSINQKIQMRQMKIKELQNELQQKNMQIQINMQNEEEFLKAKSQSIAQQEQIKALRTMLQSPQIPQLSFGDSVDSSMRVLMSSDRKSQSALQQNSSFVADYIQIDKNALLYICDLLQITPNEGQILKTIIEHLEKTEPLQNVVDENEPKLQIKMDDEKLQIYAKIYEYYQQTLQLFGIELNQEDIPQSQRMLIVEIKQFRTTFSELLEKVVILQGRLETLSKQNRNISKELLHKQLLVTSYADLISTNGNIIMKMGLSQISNKICHNLQSGNAKFEKKHTIQQLTQMQGQ